MEERPVPEINWGNLRPPYDWWHFFKASDRHPFRFDMSGFDMLNAWWLIEAATLVYSDAEFVRKTFQRAGLPVVRYLNGKSTQCFVASNDKFTIVAFRGTETSRRSEPPGYLDIFYDVLTDIRILLVPCEGGGLVHNGFQLALDEVWWDRAFDGRCITGLKSYLDELSSKKRRPVWFTGHSLGAALATLAADRHGESRGLYTFGSPRVGDSAFRNRFRPTHYRFVNHNDIVTHLPPEGLYQHVGAPKFINVNHRIGDEATSSESPGGITPAEIDDHLAAAKKLKPETAPNIPNWLLAHVPVLYSTHIWNNYIQR